MKFQTKRSFLSLTRLLLICCSVLCANAAYSSNSKTDPEAKHYIELGQMLEFNANLDTAKKAYLKAISLDPNSLEAHQGLSRINARLGNIDESVNDYKTLIRLNPENVSNWLELSALLRKEGKGKEAATLLQSACEQNKIEPLLQRELAFTLLETGDSEAAADKFQQLTEAQPQLMDNYLGLAIAQFRTGNKDLAETNIQKVLTLSPNEPSALCLLADLNLAKGKVHQSIAIYEKAIATRPSLSKPYLSLSNIYMESHDLAKAKDLLEHASRQCAPEPDIFIGLAVIEEKNNNLNKAAEYYRRALALEDEPARKNEISQHMHEIKIMDTSSEAVHPDTTVIKSP